jgi:hypothetical protein
MLIVFNRSHPQYQYVFGATMISVLDSLWTFAAITNVTVSRAQGVFEIDQCTHFNNGGVAGDCDTSQFQIRDISISNVRGSITKDHVANLKCSPRAPCPGLRIENINVVNSESGKKAGSYVCRNVINPVGFSCYAGANG